MGAARAARRADEARRQTALNAMCYEPQQSRVHRARRAVRAAVYDDRVPIRRL